MARAARSLAEKISAVTPAPVEDPNDLFATPARATPRAARHLPMIRQAIADREVLATSWLEVEGGEAHGDIHPLQLTQIGQILSLRAWVPGQGERSLRLDRILAMDGTGETFAPRADHRDLG